MSTLVSVGNGTQPFVRMLNAVIEVANQLPHPIVVQHGNTPFSFSGSKNIDFLEMGEFELFMKRSDLIIIHAGAGSVLNAIRAGKTPIVMPRRMEFGELVDNHQTEFATVLADAGSIVMVDNSKELEQAIGQALDLQKKKKINNSETRMLTCVREALLEIEDRS